jgi:hypothetical protein
MEGGAGLLPSIEAVMDGGAGLLPLFERVGSANGR